MENEFPKTGKGTPLHLEETLVIPSLGGAEIRAKIDTGNDGFNVLDAKDIEVTGKDVYFRFNGRVYMLPLHSTIDVKKGDDIEKRPVVVIPIVTIAGKQFKNVLFSLTDRTGYDEPVLIGKDFLKSINAEIII